MAPKGYKKLLVWKKADRLAYLIYQTTKSLPKEELYGITSQLRRASLSVAINLAEGCGRQNHKEQKHFTNIALGSLSETEYLLEFCWKLDYLTIEQYRTLSALREEVGRLLWRFYQIF